jgi:hypothetical protein
VITSASSSSLAALPLTLILAFRYPIVHAQQEPFYGSFEFDAAPYAPHTGPLPSSNSAYITSSQPRHQPIAVCPPRKQGEYPGRRREAWTQDVLVKCIRFALYLILLSQTRQAAGHISSDQYEGGTNEDPIHTGEHDAVAVALTRSSGALRAYPRPCLSHLRVHPVFIRLSELGSPDPLTSTPRARFVRPPTAHDAAALAANPGIAPRSTAY